ncbi:hypothetical protein ACFVH0_00920 [Streptomyces sp. NPDC127117]
MPTLDRLALARLIERGRFDHHLCRTRHLCRMRAITEGSAAVGDLFSGGP